MSSISAGQVVEASAVFGRALLQSGLDDQIVQGQFIDAKDGIVDKVRLAIVGNPAREGDLGFDPFPPGLTVELLAKAAQFNLHPVFFADEDISEERQIPNFVKPNQWFYQMIQEGKISKDATRLYRGWYLVDFTLGVDYMDGSQVFPNDPLAPMIAQLRREGKVGKYDKTPPGSRFSITHDEWCQVVCPALAQELGLNSPQVRLERYIEFNAIGNRYDRQRGQFNIWEWFVDSFEVESRLFGGYRDDGGLARVNYGWREDRHDYIAGRPLVSFS